MVEASATAPDFLVIGHVTKDLRPDGSFTIGGAATYASLTAQRLGWRAGIVTSAAPDLLARLPEALPGVAVAAVPADDSTTFENLYQDGRRRQYLRGRAAPLTPAHVPAPWRQARIVLLGPLAQEVAPEYATAFPARVREAKPRMREPVPARARRRRRAAGGQPARLAAPMGSRWAGFAHALGQRAADAAASARPHPQPRGLERAQRGQRNARSRSTRCCATGQASPRCWR